MNAAALAVTDVPDGRRVLALSGRLDADTIPDVWRDALQALKRSRRAAGGRRRDGRRLLRRRGHCAARRSAAPAAADAGGGGQSEAGVQRAAAPVRSARSSITISTRSRRAGPRSRKSGATRQIVLRDMRTQVEFLGQSTAALASAIRHPSTIRWRDVAVVCERVGADALPIVALISFLLGVILAFQSAVPMKRYGAEVFVADSDRPRHGARAGHADHRDPARRTHRRRVRGGDRHHARQPGDRRA